MTVVRLASGELFVHSPARLTAALRTTLDRLGEVRFVVPASNLHGHLYMEQYRATYSRGELWAASLLAGRRRDLAFDGLLGSVPDPRWAEDLDQAAFMGSRFLDEIVFLHRESRTLITGDTYLNIGPGGPLPARLWSRGLRLRGRAGPTPLFRFAVRNRHAARRSVERILEWDFDRIVSGHGEIVESGGREAFRDAWAWLD
jgi:hypothetical protein